MVLAPVALASKVQALAPVALASKVQALAPVALAFRLALTTSLFKSNYCF